MSRLAWVYIISLEHKLTYLSTHGQFNCWTSSLWSGKFLVWPEMAGEWNCLMSSLSPNYNIVTILTLLRLNSLYSLLAKKKKIIPTLLTNGSFAIILYSQAAPSNDLLLRLSLHANMAIRVCLTMAYYLLTARWVNNHIEFSRVPQLLLKQTDFRPM